MTVEHDQNLKIRGPGNDLIQKVASRQLPINAPVPERTSHGAVVVQGPLCGEGDADGIEVVVDKELQDLVQAAPIEAQEHVRVADLTRGREELVDASKFSELDVCMHRKIDI
eukprot:evm.model.NODE_18661_length_12656_cov_43.403683.1